MIELDRVFLFEGRRVAWTKFGEGPPLVLIHGTPFSSQVWRKIAPLLSNRWTIHLFDLLGYGASEMTGDQDVSLGVQNRRLAALFAEWKLDRPDVLAHDLGGATALRAYFLDGLRYRSLTLVDAVAVAPWGSPLVAHVRTHEAAFAGLPAYAHEALLKAYLQTAVHRPLTDEAFEIYAQPWRGELGQRAFYRQIAQMDQRFTDEIESAYRPLDCPVNILWGEEDAWIPIAQGERLAEFLSVNLLYRVPMAGHLVQEDAPDAIVATILSS